MQTKFKNFKSIVNNTVKNTDVSAHIYDHTTINGNTNNIDTNGSIVIVDNTGDTKISNFLSKYALYIDNVFIAGGYGFANLEDVENVLEQISTLGENYSSLSRSVQELLDKQGLILEFSNTGDNIDNNNSNIFYPTYNKLGYITSYKYFSVEKDISSNVDKYTLKLNTKSNITYVDSLNLFYNDEYIDMPDNDQDAIEKFKLTLSVSHYNTNTKLTYNNDIRIIVKSSASEFVIHPGENWDIQTYELEFKKPDNKFIDDLEIYTIHGEEIPEIYNAEDYEEYGDDFEYNFNVYNVNEYLYRRTYKNFLKWKDKFYYGTNSDLNSYNFRNTGFEPNNNSEIRQFVIDLETDEENSHIKYINEYDEEINIVFDNFEEASYDYLIFKKDYDKDLEKIEFYFNGLRSRNWVKKLIVIDNVNYYIWQSPQQYFGNHIWKIIIRK